MRYIVVVTVGRTGSTVLQFALNSCPGVIIRGENYNALHGFYAAYASLNKMKSNFVDSSDPFHPWYGASMWSEVEFIASTRDLVVSQILKPAGDTTHIGFKEIRYTVNHIREYGDFIKYLLFIDAVFPNVLFVINRRNPERIVQSGWWPRIPNAMEILNDADARLGKCVEDLNRTLKRQAAIGVQYEEWRANPTALMPIWQNAGLAWDEASVAKALRRRLSH